MKIGIINGPNLSYLGKREPEIYGSTTLSELNDSLQEKIMENGHEAHFFQSEIEGEIIKKIYELVELGVSKFIINPGALTHYSYALRDCISGVNKTFIEVHISNVYGREDFREVSVISDVVQGKIVGFSLDSYFLALEYFLRNPN